MRKRPHLITSSAFLSLIAVAQMLIGLVNRSIYSGIFGTSRDMDIFLLVTGLVAWFNALLIVAADKVLVPTFIGVRQREGEDRAWRMASSMVNGLVLVALAVIALVWLLHEPIITLIGVGLDPAGRELFGGLLLLAIPTMFTNLLTGTFIALLFSYHDFLLPRSLRFFGLFVIIGAILLLSPSIGIYAMAVGMLLDGLLTSSLLLWRIKQQGYAYRPFYLRLRDPALVGFVRTTLPLMSHSFFSRMEPLVDRFFASFLVVGAVSYLNYAYTLVHLPVSVLTTSMHVLLPRFSKLATHEDQTELRQQVELALRLCFFLVIPAFVGVVVLGEATIRALFEHGSFDTASTLYTARVLPFYFGLLLFNVPAVILYLVLYAHKRSALVLRIGLLDFGANIVLNMLFLYLFGYPGIALSTSIIYLLDFFLSLYYVQQITGRLALPGLIAALLRSAGAALVMGLALMAAATLLTVDPAPVFNPLDLVKLTVLGLGGMVIYFVVSSLSGSEEALYLWRWSQNSRQRIFQTGRRLLGSRP